MKEEKIFQYFKDAELREPLYIIEFPEPVTSGTEKGEVLVYAQNITPAELYDVKFVPKDNDVNIELSSDKVNPKETIIVKFTFTPSEDRIKPLKTEFTVTAKGIIRAGK